MSHHVWGEGTGVFSFLPRRDLEAPWEWIVFHPAAGKLVCLYSRRITDVNGTLKQTNNKVKVEDKGKDGWKVKVKFAFNSGIG